MSVFFFLLQRAQHFVFFNLTVELFKWDLLFEWIFFLFLFIFSGAF